MQAGNHSLDLIPKTSKFAHEKMHTNVVQYILNSFLLGQKVYDRNILSEVW